MKKQTNLYTDKKDPDVEAQVETMLTENEIYYEKSEVRLAYNDADHTPVSYGPGVFLWRNESNG